MANRKGWVPPCPGLAAARAYLEEHKEELLAGLARGEAGPMAFLERLDRLELRHARNNGWGFRGYKEEKKLPAVEGDPEDGSPREMSEEEAMGWAKEGADAG